MKTALKKSHKPALWISMTIIVMTLSCNLPGSSRNPSSDAETQPEIPTLENTAQPQSPAQSSAAENNNQVSCLEGIMPGQTNRAEVITLWGEPAATQQDGSYEALQYATPFIGQFHTIYLTNQVVEWVSTALSEDKPLTWSAVKAQYGEPAYTAFSDYLEGSRNFAFPEQGLNFIADPDLDAVFVQECFVPMSLENYMQLYGDFLPQENPFTK